MSVKEQRESILKEELEKILEATQDYCWNVLEEEMDPQAIDAVRRAAEELAYRRQYYDVMKDTVIYFPTVTRLIMTNRIQERAEKYHYETDDDEEEAESFPPEYSKALKTVCREQGLVKEEDTVENDEYMEKLAQDVDLSGS